MKKLLFFAFLATLLSSCSRIISTDYELAEHGIITAIDAKTNTLTVLSLQDDTSKEWLTSSTCDELTLNVLHYTKVLNIGDTIYLYHNGKNFLPTRCNIDDAKEINRMLCKYYWQNVPIAGLIILVAFILLTALFVKKIKDRQSIFVQSIATFTILYFLAVTVLNAGHRLYPLKEGTVTNLTADKITLDKSFTFPCYKLTTVTPKNGLKAGQYVHLYSYAPTNQAHNGSIFVCTKKLNAQALTAWQAYPEIWFKTMVLCLIILALAKITAKVIAKKI